MLSCECTKTNDVRENSQAFNQGQNEFSERSYIWINTG